MSDMVPHIKNLEIFFKRYVTSLSDIKRAISAARATDNRGNMGDSIPLSSCCVDNLCNYVIVAFLLPCWKMLLEIIRDAARKKSRC
jgi:hypothetical protein